MRRTTSFRKPFPTSKEIVFRSRQFMNCFVNDGGAFVVLGQTAACKGRHLEHGERRLRHAALRSELPTVQRQGAVT
jgi:hypothetical protein